MSHEVNGVTYADVWWVWYRRRPPFTRYNRWKRHAFCRTRELAEECATAKERRSEGPNYAGHPCETVVLFAGETPDPKAPYKATVEEATQ